jgi:hypothetical protein
VGRAGGTAQEPFGPIGVNRILAVIIILEVDAAIALTSTESPA